jgi:hypothetical protein
MPPLGLVGQAEAAPEALYIEHASVRASGRDAIETTQHRS